MQVIRDDQLFGLGMIPLFSQWNIRRCNVAGCRSKPTTIITGIPDVEAFGLCEDHHDECEVKGELDFTLDFDDFDVFKTEKVRKIGPGVWAIGSLGEIEMDQATINSRREHGLSAPDRPRHLTS